MSSFFKDHKFKEVTVQPAYIIIAPDVKRSVRAIERWIKNGCKPDGITPATGRVISEIFLSGSLAWPTSKEDVLRMHKNHFGDAEAVYAVFSKFLENRAGMLKESHRWAEVRAAFEKYLVETGTILEMQERAKQCEWERETNLFSHLLAKYPHLYFTMANKLKVRLVDNKDGDGDWQGLYVNGSLREEGHKLNFEGLLKIIADLGAFDFKRTTYTQTQLENDMGGEFPKQESDLIEGRDTHTERPWERPDAR